MMKLIFQEDKNRLREQSEDEMVVMRAFEMRRLDIAYYAIIEQAAKTKMN